MGVDFATTNLTATAAADYTDVATTLTFLAGETNKLVTVPILNDGLVEAVETFQVTLSNPVGGAELGIRTNATVRITDNDKGLAFEFASYSVAEDAGSVLDWRGAGRRRGLPGHRGLLPPPTSPRLAGQDYTGDHRTRSSSPRERK